MISKAVRLYLVKRIFRVFLFSAFCLIGLMMPTGAAWPEPLPSWNDGPVKQAIVEFVQRVVDKSGPQYLSPEERIAALITMERFGLSSRSISRCFLPLIA
jgi:hypothetical protein